MAGGIPVTGHPLAAPPLRLAAAPDLEQGRHASAASVGPHVDQWYRDAVVYELHVRSYQDSDGDGIGDFRGLISRLDYLQDLGVTALWLLPFYPSPLRDDGYDISDYRRVNPAYGTLGDFRRLLREAHRRGMRVITELVLAHTSDQHPWFQRARQAPEGSRARQFYVWSDTPDRFADARIIFQDFETSNWTWDPVAGSYYWHRFYSHQPALNYDSPDVRRAIFDIVDHWLDLGVDGLRLDAVPYLFAREGTTCENLPETFAFLADLRRHIDERFVGRMLLAEANQWPEDAAAYFGVGDSCHMAFHFPLMPRLFMAAMQEDRFPVLNILAETPDIPDSCQWAIFLRNHDELTLEMVTDEERDYMYRAYARDPQARINMGIRRRLAPLLSNDRRLIEMMNGLLFSLPGTPIVYYGDEIGMGDNVYLGDRDAVRTPMQWSPDRNAGFSQSNPQQLFLPVIIDPEYQATSVNVEAQEGNSSSLLWWMKRLIAVRNRYHAFGRGSFEPLRADNRKVLAFLRVLGDEHMLVVANLSRHAQAVELDLSAYCNTSPVELFGGTELPPVGDLPYFLTLGPYGFYWFSLQLHADGAAGGHPAISVDGHWTDALTGRAASQLQVALRPHLEQRRWFRHKSSRITGVTIREVLDLPPVPGSGDSGASGSRLVLVSVELAQGDAETYSVPLAWTTGPHAEEIDRFHTESVVAELTVAGEHGILYDAVLDPDFCRRLVSLAGRRRQVAGRAGRLVGIPTTTGRRLIGQVDADSTVTVLAAEQSNTSVVVDGAVVKLIRQAQSGTHPGVELGRFLAERGGFTHSPAVAASVEYRPSGRSAEPTTLVTIEEYCPNEGDGWDYVVDALRHGLEQALARPADDDSSPLPAAGLGATAIGGADVPDHPLVGAHLEWASLLGQRTAEMHRALVSDRNDPAFSPEPLMATDRQGMVQASRGLLRRTLRQLRSKPGHDAVVERLLAAETHILDAMRPLVSTRLDVARVRCHGDYHLGQVLWTGRDFVVVDFEGEPNRSLSFRRLKRPALTDVAGMLRSFHYAAQVAAMPLVTELATSSHPDRLEPLLGLWYRSVSTVFLRSYLDAAGDAVFLPPREQFPVLLDYLLLEKAIYELSYEVNSRPEWVRIPAAGILELTEPPA